MDLSNDLISKFVKITSNQSNNKTKEGTAYGTIVEFENKMYVKLDGSDLLTPINSTSDVKDGERVTIMIKDHNAVVTGNITSPSASSGDVKKVTQDVTALGGEIAEFETIVANKVGVDELDAEVARINDLIAGRATIEDLNATNAEIVNLQAKDAEIVNLVAGKAEIDDLTATNAEIESLKAKDAEITSLVAGKANISDLTAINADIVDLKAKDIETDNLLADKASIGELNAVKADINDLQADKADIGALNAAIADIETLTSDLAIIDQAVINKANIGDLNAANAQIAELQANKADITDLDAAKADISDLQADKADIGALNAAVANIETLTSDLAIIDQAVANKANITDLNAANAQIADLQANKANITDLNATNANINTLDAEVADIQTLVNGNLTSDNIASLNLTSANTTIQNAMIKDAMIDSITASKIKSGIIDTNLVTIQSTDGSMVLTGSVQQFKDENGVTRIQIGKDTGGNFTFILYDESGTGVLIDEDGIKSSNAIADGLIVDAKVADNANIAGSKLDIASVITEVNNDNSTTIKSNKIYLDEQGQSLEVAFNSLKTQVETIQDVSIDGDLTTVMEQVQSNTTQIEANKEGISTLVAENTVRKEEIQNLDGEIESVNNTLSSKYSSLEQDVSGFKTTVAETYTTKSEAATMNDTVAGNRKWLFEQYTNNQNVGASNGTYPTLEHLANETLIASRLVDGLPGYTSEISDHYIGVYTIYLYYESAYTWNGSITSDDESTTYLNGVVVCQATTCTPTAFTMNFKKGINKLQIIHGEGVGTDGVSLTDLGPWKEYGAYPACVTAASSNYYASNSDIEQKANEITQTVSETYATKQSVTDINNNLSTNYSTTEDMNSAIEQKANEITSSVSETYATKQSVTDINNNLSTNYSTTEAMNSAITQKANEITQTVSETYATKQSVTDVSNNLSTNYSTTSAMNSAIEQKANEITSSVSETYATKQSVTDVSNNLSTNYSTTSAMNSAIEQKANEITSSVSETYATKQSVTDVSNNLSTNYSTTSAMNSAIEQKANEITSSVSETYTTKTEFNNLQIGGTNLLPNSGNFKDNYGLWVSNGSSFTLETVIKYNGYNTIKIHNDSDAGIVYNDYITLRPNTTYTYSITAVGAGIVTGTNNHPLHMWVYPQQGDNGTYHHEEILDYSHTGIGTSWGRSYIVFKTPDTDDVYLMKPFIFGTGHQIVYVANFKVEEGNRPTAWSPAPEDIQSQIDATNNNLANNYSTTSAINSAIVQKANEITSSVSETYATKQSVTDVSNNLTTNYSTTSAMNSAIQQKANEITSSVSETYATKQSVTDINNNLSTNYSTTSAMNSAIQQKANEITSSVSETYTTKSEFNNLEIGGTNTFRISRVGSDTWDINYGSSVTANSENGFNVVSANGKMHIRLSYTIKDNGYWTVRFKVKSSVYVGGIYIDICDKAADSFNSDTNWSEVTRTVLVDNYSADPYHFVDIEYHVDCGQAITYYFKDVKVEKGNKATSWSPAPEDVQGQIDATNNNLANNYSTTSVMNSAIQQKANEITSSVSETYTTKSEFNNLQIGGTNLIQNGNFKGAVPSSTSMPDPWTFWGNDIHIYHANGAPGYNHVGCVYIGCNLTDGSQSGIYSNRVHVSKVEKGANYMASFIFTRETNVKDATAHLEYLNDACDQILHSQVLATARPTDNVVNGLYEHQYHIPFTMWTGDFSYMQITFNHGGTNAVSNGYLMIVGNVQIEKGNKATAWSPAPEDIQGQIDATNNNLATNYSTTTQMNSAINQKANEITSSVSQTYTTKSETTAVQNQITTSRNLLMGSRDYNLGKWSPDAANILDEWYNGTRIYTTTVAWASMDYWVSDLIDRGVIELSTPYTFSCYVMSTGSDYTPNIRFFADGLPNFSSALCGTATTSWQRISITIEWSSFDNRSYPIRFEADTPSPSGSHLKWACYQLERGRVATGWAPAPEDAQYAINDVNNNLATNFSTTTQMNSAIQQKANEIISSVSQTYISNYEAKKLADTTTTGLNKYLFERYQRDGFDYGARPTLNDLVGARLIESQLVDNPPVHTSDLGSNYIGVLTFYLYYDYACTKTVTITTDDHGTVYLNNVGIYELTSCQPANVTFNMSKGLNRIDIVYAEGGGGDGVSWGGVDGWVAFGAYANTVTNEIANRTNELTLAMTQGNMLYTDPTFRNGLNSTGIYNNYGNGTVTNERIAAIEGCPNTSGYCMKITTNGEATPGLGGFFFGTWCRYNAVYITKITAKIPVGYTIGWASNSIGNNGEQKWLSSTSGTGDWYDYYCKVKCGNSGDLSGTNYFYIFGAQATAENPVTWYVSYATVFDVTDSDERITNLTNNLATNYSTTTQMNSAIDQKANEITSSVSQTYTTKTEFNNLEVGGTNLVYNGGFNRNLDGWNANGGSCGAQVCTESPSGCMLCISATNHGNGLYQYFTFHDSTYCTDYVVSFYAKTDVDGSQMYVSMEGDPATSSVFTLNGGWQKCVYKFRRSNTGSNALVFYANGNGTRNIYIHSIKMEKGTVPSAWSPHPSEIENKVDNLSNNLTNNYSTTVQMNSAIQQKANEITSSVSQAYVTKSEAATMNDTVAGNRKWLFEQYTNNQNVGSGNGTYPTLAHLANETLIASRLVDGLPGHLSELGTNYLGVYTVYLYYESAYTWNGYIISDDESTTYLNGVAVCQAPTCTSTTFTMNFKKGINKLQIIHGEGGGGDGVTLSDLGPWKEYGAYPACVTAASSNYYASNSDIVQTVNDLTIKFTESGGYNLLQNGHADKGSSYWVNNGGSFGVSSGAGGGATGNFFTTSLPHGFYYYDWVQLLPNTHYVYQAKVWTDITFTGNSWLPLHYWFSYDASTTTNEGYTILDYQQSVSAVGVWTQLYLHFVTGNNNIYIKPFIYNDQATTATFFVTELMLSQSRVVQPWSPHPSEVYSGITQIDKDGIRVQHSNFNGYTHMAPTGFYINHNGSDVVALDAAGLRVTGSITATSGQIAHYTINEHALVGHNVGLCGHPDYGYWALWSGSGDSGSAPFRVGHGGELYATNATISGNITASSGHIGGTTTIDGNCLVTGSITANKLCIGDTNNYCQLTKGASLTSRYGTSQWSGSDSHFYWSSSSTYLPFTIDGTRNPFKEGDRILFDLDIYCQAYAGSRAIGVFFYSDDNSTDYITDCCSSVEILAGWNNYKFEIVMNNAWVKAAKTIAILAHIDGVYTEVRNVVIRRKVSGELIVDGSITADKIAADAITGKTITGGTISGTHISGTTFTSTGTDGNSNQYQTMTLNSGALMLTGAIVGGTNDGQEANRTYLTSMGLVVKDSSNNGFGGDANALYTNTGIYWNSKAAGGEEYPNWQQLIGYYDDYVLIDRLPLRMPKEIYTSGVATSYTNIYVGPAADGEAKVVAYDSSWGVANSEMNFRPIRASAFYRKDGKHAYINATGGGTLTDGNSTLVSNGMRTDLTDFYLGVAGRVRVTDKNGYNNGSGITYKPIMASAFENGSDLMFKKNIRTTDDLDVIDILNKVEVYRYDMIGGNENEIGLIAQACPSDLISGTPYDMDIQTANEITDEDRQSLVDPDNGGASVNLYHMASILWKVCKEQQKRIERLENSMKGEE